VDAIDVVVLALRLLLVALLYLFLFAVLRLAIGGLRASAGSASSVRAQRLTLVVVEPGASSLRAGQVLDVPDGATLGRADGADVVLADSAISARHARVERAGRRWVVTDLGSTNGTRVNDAVVRGQTSVSEGDVVSLGTVRLQVRAR
jgi:pSer/pThr/pTyr-binding forkhead associated (FHA) protein